MQPFVVVHAGAGYHSPSNSSTYKKLVNDTVNSTLKLLYSGASAAEGVGHCIRLMEAHPSTNAGIVGSNMSVDGHIQADASIMTETGVASVGAVPTVANTDLIIHPSPISIALKLLSYNSNGVDKAGRQPPILIVGYDAHSFAREQGMEMMTSSRSMLSIEQLERYGTHIGILSKSETAGDAVNDPDRFDDTVGAVVIDINGNMASGVSSGGISLKRSGRVGEAAMPGSGLFVGSYESNIKVGCSLSGTGEQIMRTFLGSVICDAVSCDLDTSNALASVIQKQFLDSKYLQKESTKNMGVILVKQNGTDRECWWAHTTESFCIGFGSRINELTFKISRRNPKKRFLVAGNSI